MTKEIHNFASRTTPKDIYVGNGINSLIIWAVGKFGTGALIGGLAIYALIKVYDDNKIEADRRYSDFQAQSAQWLEAYKEQSRIQQNQVKSQLYLIQAINALADISHKQRPNLDKIHEDFQNN
jgi:hypothetical protein